MKRSEEGKIEKETNIKTYSMVCVCRVPCAFKVRGAEGACLSVGAATVPSSLCNTHNAVVAYTDY